MAKQIYIDENGNEQLVSGTINNAELLPISSSDPTNTKDYIDSVTPKYYTTPQIPLANLTWVATGGGKYRAVYSLTGALPSGSILLGITIQNFGTIRATDQFMPYINVNTDREFGIMSNVDTFATGAFLGFRIIYI